MSSLPAGWTQAQVGDLVTLNPKNDAHDCTLVGFVPMSRLGVDYRSPVSYEPRRWSDIKKGYTHFADGDVLLAKITPCFENGKAGLASDLPNGLGAGSTEYFVSRPKDGVLDARYLLGFFKTETFLREGALQMTGSVGHKRVPKEYLLETEIPLAPFNEQKRIADKLDAVLARVDACRDRLDRIPAILKRFRLSVLAAATSGKLTEDWRAEQVARKQPQAESANTARDSVQLRYTVTASPNSAALDSRNEAGWREVRLAEIADVQGGITKDVKKQSPEDEEVPYLRVANVQRGHLDLTEVKSLRVPADRLAALLLEPGDILFNEGGDIDKLGRGWIWEGQIGRCSFQNHVFRARLYDKENEPKYISWWGNFRGLDYFLRSGKQTTNLASINKTMLSNLPISLPPPEEQTEIVRRVESLFAYAGRLEARYAAARAKVEKLTPATLAKAFRGELVPQDPNDEPASVLLERIRAQRGAAPATRSARRSAAPSAAELAQ